MRFDIKAISRTTGAVMEAEAVAAPNDVGLDFPGFTFDPASRVTLSGSIQNAGHGLLVLTGEVSAEYGALCARCLTPILRTIRIPIRETYRSLRTNPGERTTEPEPEESGEDETYVYDDYTVDVSEAVRENLLTALPIREVCRPDCAGLCPVCGADRNKNPCGCLEGQDPDRNPFGKLKNLL